MDYYRISKIANAISKKFETRNPFEIATYLGIGLKFENMTNVKGFYTCIIKNRFIIINNSLDETSAKIVCAHEIGHDRFHRGLGVSTFSDESCVSVKSDKAEIEANCFAAEFLIPDDIFLELATGNFTYEQLAAGLNIHTELAIIKAKILNNKGFKLNIPYSPKSNYLSNKFGSSNFKAAEEQNDYTTD